jgi:hypothetical protein
VECGEQRAESREKRAENGEQRAESRERTAVNANGTVAVEEDHYNWHRSGVRGGGGGGSGCGREGLRVSATCYRIALNHLRQVKVVVGWDRER